MPIRAVYVPYLFLREALHRLTGISRSASPATTGFAFAILGAAALHPFSRVLGTLRQHPFTRPSAGTVMLAAGAIRYAARSIGGEQLGETPAGDAIIVATLAVPALKLANVGVLLVRGAVAAVWRLCRYIVTRPPPVARG